MTQPLAKIGALLRAGAASRAWDAFVAAGLDGAEDSDALSLRGRLLKDRARLATGPERLALFAQAAASYQAAAALWADSYPLINAAAMSLFSGDRVRAELIASKVLHLLDSGADKGETPYWGEATRAEALLLLGRRAEAVASLERAIALAPQAWEDRAATLRQLALIASETQTSGGWLDRFRSPPVLHFSGVMGIVPGDTLANQAIKEAIIQIAPGFAFGALAAGADIISAETLVGLGAELHIVLPSDPDDFRRASVEPFGDEWPPRFDTLLQRAQSVTVCCESATTSDAGVALADLHAMGLTAELAGRLETRAVALRIARSARSASGDPWLLSKRDLVLLAAETQVPSTPAVLPSGHLSFDVAIDGDEVLSLGALDDAVAALATAGDQPAAFDCRIGGAPTVRGMLSRGEPGMIVASRSAALALLACGAVNRLEPIGEMATPSGPVEVCLTKLAALEG